MLLLIARANLLIAYAKILATASTWPPLAQGLRRSAFCIDGANGLSSAGRHDRRHWCLRTAAWMRFQPVAGLGLPVAPERVPSAQYPAIHERSCRWHESHAEGCGNSWPSGAPERPESCCPSPDCGPMHHGPPPAGAERLPIAASFVARGPPAARIIQDRPEGVLVPLNGGGKPDGLR